MVFNLENAKINYKGQGTVYLETPECKPFSAVIAVHGSNRGALDYRDNDFYKKQRDIALKNGCVFACISNKWDTWGRDDGLYNINLLADYLIKNYPVEKVILWATSAGGTLAYRMVKEYPQKIAFVIGTFPVYDILSTFPLQTCRVAWKTHDFEKFKCAVKGKNPAEFQDCLNTHRYYIAHGTADTAVPFKENSLKLSEDVGGNVYLQTVENGTHSTTDYSFYTDAVEKAFAQLNK